jgi:hypothetical protein
VSLWRAILSLVSLLSMSFVCGFGAARVTAPPQTPCAPCLPVAGEVPNDVRQALEVVGATLDRMDARCVLLPERDRLAVVPVRRAP